MHDESEFEQAFFEFRLSLDQPATERLKEFLNDVGRQWYPLAPHCPSFCLTPVSIEWSSPDRVRWARCGFMPDSSDFRIYLYKTTDRAAIQQFVHGDDTNIADTAKKIWEFLIVTIQDVFIGYDFSCAGFENGYTHRKCTVSGTALLHDGSNAFSYTLKQKCDSDAVICLCQACHSKVEVLQAERDANTEAMGDDDQD
jgi:hypothetical protein